MEGTLSRIIDPDSAGKKRNRRKREVVLALRELLQQTHINKISREFAAFIGLALAEIYATVDVSVSAWEKRGYWVKADKFRLEWEWADLLGNIMQQAVLNDDWEVIAITTARIAQKLMNVNVSVKNRLGKPWEGAFDILKSKSGIMLE